MLIEIGPIPLASVITGLKPRATIWESCCGT
jgi:hypothetical protein